MAGRDPKAAAKEFQEAVRIDPTFSPARTNLARVYIEQGKRGDARRELETVLGSNPGDREARALREGLR
jgi:Tfp pilus assembly protein PilF